MPEAERKARATPGTPDFARDVMDDLPRWGKPVQRVRDDLQSRAAARRGGRGAGVYYPALSRGPERKEAPP